MSEYWVSTAKYYCKYCNMWMADNKPSRLQHDSNLKHKQNVEISQKKKREEKLYGARDEADLQRQLADIERAAHSAIKEDRKSANSIIGDSKSIPASNLSHPGSRRHDASKDDNIAANRDKSNGFYMVRGQGYLEGEFNESLLVANATCQIFIEPDDDWYDAVIVGRREISVPHTEVTIKLFTIDIKGSDGKWTREEGIRSEKLRLLATAEGEPTEVDGRPIQSYNSNTAAVKSEVIKPVEKPKINEATGISGWQTISVVVVDQEDMKRQREEDERKEREELEQAEKLKLQVLMKSLSDNHDNDVMSRGSYKGVPLSKPELVDASVSNLAGGRTVEFRKRKISSSDTDNYQQQGEVQLSTASVKGKRPTRQRLEDDDEEG